MAFYYLYEIFKSLGGYVIETSSAAFASFTEYRSL